MSVFPLDRLTVSNLLAPAADAAGRTSAVYPTVKNAHMVSLIFKVNQGNAATILITPLQASAVAGTGSKALSANVPIYTKLDSAASDVWVRQTDAKNFTTDAGVKVKYVRFDIDPDALDLTNGFDCIGVSTGASNAANITSADLVMGPLRYVEDVSIAAITD
jgi:hypothetical protein